MFIIAGGIILAIFLLAMMAVRPDVWLWIIAAISTIIALIQYSSDDLRPDSATTIQIAMTAAFAAFVIGGAFRAAKNRRARAEAKKWYATFKVCPACAETVKIQATVCKHCGHEFTAAAAAA
jgi:hypothetical protein